MNREQFIKEQISNKGYSIKSFSAFIDMPYSTLLSMLNGSIGGAAVDNVIKICNGLNITISELQEHTDTAKFTDCINLTEHEKRLVTAYRNKPEMQPAINTLLGIDDE